MVKAIAARIRSTIICVVLVLAVALGRGDPAKTGTYVQLALPTLALACSAINGNGKETLLRFVALEVVVHGSKNLLGEIELNQRPNGHYKGFPSGHTAAAAFGASALVNTCIMENPYIKSVVILSAVFVGGTRLVTLNHSLMQVLCGAFIGWAMQWLFRLPKSLFRLARRRKAARAFRRRQAELLLPY